MAELPKDVLAAHSGNNHFAAKNKKTDKMSALERLFYLINDGIKLNPDEYKISFVKIILLGFFIFELNSLWAISNISSPNKSAYSYQYIPINGAASEDSKKIEVQICQVESKTYWDGRCWVGTPNWLFCNGTTSWTYPISTYFSENLSYNIKSRSTDISGNVEVPSVGVTFFVDKRPPTSYISFPESGKTYSDVPKIYGQASDWGSGVAFVRVRLNDLTDGTYWNGNGWTINEVWVKAEGVSSFSVSVDIWKINHQYNVTSQAVDFAQLEQSLYSGWNFSVICALKLSAKTSKQTYNYGDPVEVEINLENTSQSTQTLELPSSKIYDFTIDSLYKYSDTKIFTPTKTQLVFNPGTKLYSEKIDKIIPKGQHLLSASIESITLASKYIFDVIADTISPSVALQPVADGQYRYFSIPVAANITDNSDIKSVTLFSGANFWEMLKTSDNLWTGAIPADYNTANTLSYHIEVVDMSGNKTITETKTISIKDVPAPKPEDITVAVQQECTYLIGLKNFAELSGVYYRVYYDKGTGIVDYSNSLGAINESTKTIITPKLTPSTDYKFIILPVTELSENNMDAMKSSDIPEISIRTPSNAEEIKTPDDDANGGRIKIRVPLPPLVEISTDVVSIGGTNDGGGVSILPIVPDPIPIPEYQTSPEPTLPKKPTDYYYYIEVIPAPQPIVLDYIDDNQDGFLDGTFIKETTLVILKYNEFERKWVGGFETTVNTELNKCFAFVPGEGKYALFSVFQIYPVPVSNLTGEATEKSEAKISWQPSPSANSQQYNVYYDHNLYLEKFYSAKYRIYWDKGTGIVDYSRVIVELQNPATSFISNPLEKGLYKFAVRVVDIEGTEEKNTNYVTVNINVTGSATANIRIPKEGKRVRGNAVTVIADSTSETTAVMFQYKNSDGKWIDISTVDKKPPYAVYWNLSSLPNGKYLIRAIAYDSLNLPDTNPAETTVHIDDVNWDISEDGNPSMHPNVQHIKQEKIPAASQQTNETEVMTADGTGAIVPEGIVEKESVLEIKTLAQENLPLPTASSLQPIDVFRDYNFSDGKSEFEKDLTIILPYPDENNDGIVDGTDVKTESLEIYYLDEKNSEWKKADNRSGLGDGTNPGQGDGRDNSKNDGTNNPNNKKVAGELLFAQSINHKTVSAKVNHFTKFGIFAKTPKTNLDTVSVYPNPFKPSYGHTQITFDGLTANIKIKIYTIAGRLVDEFETETSGSYNWNPGDTASGVYIYYIKDKNGTGSKKGKLAIIR
ncbi:MAG: T9SS type A sorting domain-containing protein [Elusimicrobia bacterium]|nr:T9SS type A sorting domain-containing protein [Elusimicrobiota bacterium]